MKKLMSVFFAIISMIGFAFADVVSYEGKIYDKEDVNSFDRIFMNDYSKTLDYLGTGFEAACILTPAFLINIPKEDYWKVGIEYAETMAFAYGAKEIAKHCVDRKRPYMYFSDAPQKYIDDGDYKNSFFSGHTTISFAAASFTTYQYLRYFPDSKYKISVIAACYGLASTTASLRLASGNHFMTDVLTGAAVGTAIGFFVPWINGFLFNHHLPENINASVTPLGFSMMIKY